MMPYFPWNRVSLLFNSKLLYISHINLIFLSCQGWSLYTALATSQELYENLSWHWCKDSCRIWCLGELYFWELLRQCTGALAQGARLDVPIWSAQLNFNYQLGPSSVWDLWVCLSGVCLCCVCNTRITCLLFLTILCQNLFQLICYGGMFSQNCFRSILFFGLNCFYFVLKSLGLELIWPKSFRTQFFLDQKFYPVWFRDGFKKKKKKINNGAWAGGWVWHGTKFPLIFF